MPFPDDFNPIERAIWARTWLALRAFLPEIAHG
jgi:hypothetical protein